MAKIFSLIILLPFTSILLSQYENISLSRRKREMGFDIGVNLNYRLLTAEKNNAMAQNIVESRNQFERMKRGMTAGFHLDLPIFNKWYLGLAANYANMGYVFETPVFTGSGTQTTFGTSTLIYNYHSLLVPVSMKYFNPNKKVSLVFGFGVGPHAILSARQKRTLELPHSISTSEDKAEAPFRLALFAQASLGVRIQITGKLSTRIEWVNNMDAILMNPSPVRGRLYNSGIQLGVYF
jgi:hypothetical protein